MVSIDYDRGRVLRYVAFSALGVAWGFYILGHPGIHVPGRYALVFEGAFGHWIAAPTLIVGSLLMAWRFLGLISRGGHAVSFEDDAMVIRAGGRPKRLAWRDFERAEIRHVVNQKQLWLRRAKGRPIRVSIGLTKVRARPEAAIEVIELMQTRAFALGHRVSSGLEADLTAPPHHAPNFDAEAALARYMAKKEAGLIEAPGPAPGVRRQFGRKVS